MNYLLTGAQGTGKTSLMNALSVSMLKLQGAAIIDMNTNSNITMENDSSINLNNGKIAINEQGVTFEQGAGSITFTFSELEQLKALITPSEN